MPRLRPYEEHAGTPKDPSVLYYQTYGNGAFSIAMFDVPLQDTEGRFMDPKKLSYRLYIDDDEPYILYPDEYKGITEEMEEIPYLFNDKRCGFLGLLHMEIVQERLDREFNMDVITTVPNVSYMVYTKQGEEKEVHNPSGLPDQTMIDHIEEPYIRASVITTTAFIGPIMKLCLDKRGELIKQEFVGWESDASP